MWAWKRLKLRYVLDTPESGEFRAFRRAMRDPTPAGRGLACALMLARTDRLFRETTLEVLSPHLQEPGLAVDPSGVAADVETRMRQAGLAWSRESRRAVASHILSSWRELGLTAGVKERRTVIPRPTPAVARFAVELARLTGLTDSQALDSPWLRLFGLDRTGADRLLAQAARVGSLGYRTQAEVVEIDLPSES
jgi:hypothetical protein